MGYAAGCSPRKVRLLSSFVALIVLTGTLVATIPSVARAQEDPPPEKKEEKVEAPKEKTHNLFTHIVSSAGWFFGPLLFFVSIALVTLIVLLAMDLRMGVAVPPSFVDDFTEMINKKQFKQAFDLCRNDNSFIARVLTAGMGRLQYGIDDARDASLNMVDSVRAGKDNLITYLATIGTLGPMLGLVGTVYGMILSFMELSGGGTPKPEKLAEGISHALVVTLLGIGISVPAIFCYSFFKNRLTRITMDTSNLADDLLTQMYHNSKRAAAAPATQERTVSSSQIKE
jgi:biopolymer transport protein ExbB